MKRWVLGHKRITIPVNGPPGRGGIASGGWDTSCLCGWEGGNWPTQTTATVEYKKHLDYILDECLFKCKRCGESKPLIEMKNSHRYLCKLCGTKISTEWQQNHPVEATRQKRNHHLLKFFGITLEEYEALLLTQEGVCAICRTLLQDPRGYSPHVDHNHLTGQLRGVLCAGCNMGLGSFGDSTKRLRAAIAYLEKYTEVVSPM